MTPDEFLNSPKIRKQILKWKAQQLVIIIEDPSYPYKLRMNSCEELAKVVEEYDKLK